MGASLHPWGLTGCRYASDRGEPTGRSATPSHRTHRPAYHPINDTREASQLSDSRRTAAHFNQRSAGPKPSAPRWACLAGLRPAPKGCLAPGQPERGERATRCESSLLERPPPVPAHSAHDAGHRRTWRNTPAPSGQRPEESAPPGWVRPGPRPGTLPSGRWWPAPTRWPNARAPGRPQTVRAPAAAGQ